MKMMIPSIHPSCFSSTFYLSCICLLYSINYSLRRDEYFTACWTSSSIPPLPCLSLIHPALPLPPLLLCSSASATVTFLHLFFFSSICMFIVCICACVCIGISSASLYRKSSSLLDNLTTICWSEHRSSWPFIKYKWDLLYACYHNQAEPLFLSFTLLCFTQPGHVGGEPHHGFAPILILHIEKSIGCCLTAQRFCLWITVAFLNVPSIPVWISSFLPQFRGS